MIFMNVTRNLAIRILLETGYQVKSTRLTVAARNKPTPDSRLLQLGFPEYKSTCHKRLRSTLQSSTTLLHRPKVPSLCGVEKASSLLALDKAV